MKRSLRFIIALNELRANSFFLKEFNGGNKEVVIKPPFIFIKVIKKDNDFRFFEAIVSEPLTDMCPVFLFNMRVVIGVIGA